jgi:ribonuclease HI
LDHVAIDRSVKIFTDSNYSIKCLTEWFQKWEGNNWRNSSGKEVENKDLIKPIIARIREREMCRAKTTFQWIKGHANDPGNSAADLLAVQGSRFSTPQLRNMDIRTISPTLGGPDYHDHEEPKMKVEPVDESKTEMINDEDFGSHFAEGSAQAKSSNVSNHLEDWEIQNRLQQAIEDTRR